MSTEAPRCYSRVRNQRPDLYPCSLDGSIAQCCEANQTCASNGLCVHDAVTRDSARTPYTIGGCIDSTWKDEGCVSECVDVADDVAACPGLGPGYFCCLGSSGCNCSSTDNAVVFRKKNVEFVASLLPDGTLQSTGSISGSTIPSATSSAILTTTSATSATSSETSVTKSGSSHNTLGVGLGVGLGLGIPLVLAVLAVFVLWKRRQKKPPTVPSSNSPSDDPTQHLPVSPHEKPELYTPKPEKTELDALTPGKIELDTHTPGKMELDTPTQEQYNLARHSEPAELAPNPRLP